MTKFELVNALAKRCEIPLRRAYIVVDTFFERLTRALINGEKVQIRNFGNLEVRHYDGYTGRNPKTGQKVRVSPKRLPLFKAGLGLRNMLNRHPRTV
jgi:integration host factor subunit beta